MKKKTKVVLIISFIIILILILMSFFFYQKEKEIKYKNKLLKDKKVVEKIKNHYNNYVITNKKSNLYIKDNNNYKKIGTVKENKEFTLKKQKINKDTKYFLIDNLNYYIKYEDVDKIDNLSELDTRYKSYLPFNENIITKDKINLYKNNNLVYELKTKLDTPIIIKDDTSKYIEFDNELYLIKNEDIESTYQKENTNLKEATSVPVTVYHFIYLEGDNSCNEVICHSEKQIRSHFNYLKENNFFTITSKELEWFIDKKVKLPEKSIQITIDDGARAENFIPLLEEYKINATLFLITGWYPKEKFSSPYLEIASHTDNLHEGGKCPGDQGSPLKCLEKEILINDLKTSRDKLDQTEAFCYPFYEYNNYSENILKEVGFKTAYIGGMRKATPGINKYQIPRITIMNDTTLNEYVKYVN